MDPCGVLELVRALSSETFLAERMACSQRTTGTSGIDAGEVSAEYAIQTTAIANAK